MQITISPNVTIPTHILELSYNNESNIQEVSVIIDPTSVTQVNSAIISGGVSRVKLALDGYLKYETSKTAETWYGYLKDAYTSCTPVKFDSGTGETPIWFIIKSLSKTYTKGITEIVYYSMSLIQTF